jgi:hypothetical protein
MVGVCETILSKHANNLKNLRIDDLEKNMRAPNLPVLDCLTLATVGDQAAWNILENCRPTITRLDLRNTPMNSPPINSNSVAYEIPNIKYLSIVISRAFNFVQFNAEHLVTLDLRVSHDDDIPDNVEWPQFPKLRELKTSCSKWLPIIKSSRETLEHLYIEFISSSDIGYASMVMPRLTDLHLNNVNNAFTSKICSSNHRSLEFLTLNMRDLPNLDDGMKMERMRNVVLRSEHPPYYTAQDRERMTELCPNAEVVILRRGNRKDIRDQMKSRELFRSRFNSKNFSLDFIDI